MVERPDIDADGTREPPAELEQHHPEAFAWAVSCCNGDHAMAEDVLQTSYLKILDGRARFSGRSSFRTWLFSVIRHTAADTWRSPWRRKRVPLSDDEQSGSRGVEPPNGPDLHRIAAALAGLPLRQSQVLTLIYGHGLTLREAADVLGISRGSAATHLHRGKTRLRERLVGRERKG